MPQCEPCAGACLEMMDTNVVLLFSWPPILTCERNAPKRHVLFPSCSRRGVLCVRGRGSNGIAEGFPHAPIPFRFLAHSFGMKLETDDKVFPGIVEAFNQAVIGMRHGPETRRQIADALVMVAVHHQ